MTKQILLILAFLLTSQIFFGQSLENKNSIDEFLIYLSKENSFLGTVEMKKGNEIVYSYKSNPLEAENGQYRIGSITKIFTAITVFQLIEEQKLTLQTPLSQFYPKIKYADQITIENLLSHTSGIFNITFGKIIIQQEIRTFQKSKFSTLSIKKKPTLNPIKTVRTATAIMYF